MVAANEFYQLVDVNISKIAAMMPRLIAKDILSAQPMMSPVGDIFKLRPIYDPALTRDAQPRPDEWFGGYSDNRTLMHPFKYGDKYLNGETYFYKIKLRGL